MQLEKLVGLILLLYGLMKIITSIIKVLPRQYDDLFPYIKHDRTTAGYVLDGILFIFGVYALLHGLRLLEQLHPTHSDILINVYTTVALYTIIGIFLLIFYSIVLYTHVPIDKNDKQIPTYALLGLGGGFMFLLSVSILLAWHIYYDEISFKFIRKSYSISFLITLTLVLTIVNAMIIYKYRYKNRKNKDDDVDDINNVKGMIFDLVMMPLGSVS